MTNEEKFSALKEKKIEKNEEKYGTEIRMKYGDKEVNDSYQKMRKMSKYQMEEAKRLENEIKADLKELVNTKSYTSKEAMEMCQKHQEWIKLYWPSYSKEAHIGLVDMYLEDERFMAYYEKVIPGATVYLNKAMKHFLK